MIRGDECDIVLACASHVTKTMKQGTGIVLVPKRHAFLLAKETSSSDPFSGGHLL